MPVRVAVRDPFLALDRLEVRDLRHAARRREVVEDRLVAGEPLEAHDLLGQKPAVIAELDVPFARNFPSDLIRGHGAKG